ncbi:MAG: hypothetical protein ISS92_02860 [Candidatus Omnitrophica bacterium]|nr:hypothetical protein [Candidatus Omnitrophota bacterium]
MRKLLSVCVVIYGAYMSYASLLLINLFSSGWFKDPFNLVIAKIMLPLSIVCAICGIALFFLKQRARICLLFICLFYIFLYVSAITQAIIRSGEWSMDARGILILLAPILFLIFFARPGERVRD